MKKNLVIVFLLFAGMHAGYMQNNAQQQDSVYTFTSTHSKKALDIYHKGMDAFNLGDFTTAIRDFKSAIDMDSAFVDAYNRLGNAYRFSGRTDSAEFFYNKALHFNPNDITARSNLGIVYLGAHRFDEANTIYKEIIHINPQNPEGYFGLTNLALMSNQYDIAIENGLKTVAIYEKTNSTYIADGYYLLGIAYYYNNNDKDAKTYLKKAKDLGAQIDPAILKELRIE